MKNNLILPILLSMAFFFTACAGNQTKEVSSSAPILIETKAQIKSKDEKNNVKIDIALARNRAIRMEVTATLGYRVATVVMTPQLIQYALHTSETFYQGPFTARTIYPIFNQMIDPKILWKAIHDQNPQSANLICQVDTSSRPTSCQGPQNLTVKWTYEEPPFKKIELKNSQFEMVWLFKDQSVLDNSQTETFVLKKPDGYKEIILK